LDDLMLVPVGPQREAWRALLELADEPAPLATYLQLGELYGFVDRATREAEAAVLVMRRADGTPELRAVAVRESVQGRGIGTRIVNAVIAELRRAGATRVIVGTANSGTRQLAFYQRLGFRLTHIETDYFTAEKGYPAGLSENGIATRDMVWMTRSL
jgi:ribosomal protein S18 acetylase RimI-like enzyme